MDGFVYDAGSDEVVGGKRYVGSSSVARLMRIGLPMNSCSGTPVNPASR